jgi:hypothetical protein
VSDASPQVDTCSRPVTVLPADGGGPTPPSGGNRPPSVQNLAITQVPGVSLRRTITALIVDPDPGDTVSWTLEILSGPAAFFATVTPDHGAGPTLSSVFNGGEQGTYTLRAHAFDNHGAEGVLQFTVTLN